MKKIIVLILIAAFLLISLNCMAITEDNSGPGPAPSSGDSISEGPEWGDARPDGIGPGPAPNSGDGVPDHSGF